MNSWKLILFVQLLANITIIFDIPVARQMIGFLYLTFIVGFILTRIFELNNLGIAQTALFSVGFSVSMLMFLGLLINEVLPIFGVPDPLSTWSLMITINIITVMLYLISYFAEKDFKILMKIQNFHPLVPLFICLPLLSILGALNVNIGGNNLLLLLMIIIISAILLLVTFFEKTKFFSSFNSLVLLTVALSLVLHTSLITNYIVGQDIYEEFYVFNLANDASHWISTNPSTKIGINKVNAMLSVTILPTVYSQILNVDGNLIFKFIFPFILSWLAVGLYKLYCTQTDKKTALLSVFFFTANSVFFFLFGARQMIAELFFVLLFLVFFHKSLSPSKKNVCFVIFGAALVVSHYSMAYVFLFFIFLIWLSQMLQTRNAKMIRARQILYLFTLAFSWYIFISGSPFESLVETINFISRNLYSDFFNPEARGTLVISALGGGEVFSIWHQISRVLFYISELFIVIGFIEMVLRVRRMRKTGLNQEFVMLSFLNLIILSMTIVIPHFAGSLQVTRIYQIALLSISPLCILGGKAILGFFLKQRAKAYYFIILVSLFLIPFFLFQTGFVYAVTGDVSWSIPLSIRRGEVENLVLYDNIVNEQEVLGAQWLHEKTHYNSIVVYADAISYGKVLTSYGMIPSANMRILSNNTRSLGSNSYIYLRKLNVVNGIIIGKGLYQLNATEFSPMFNNLNRLYSNGGCEIYVSFLTNNN